MDTSRKEIKDELSKNNAEIMTLNGALSTDSHFSTDSIENMTAVMQDVQTTSKTILQRLGDVISNLEQECTCKCHTLELNSEMQYIKTRLRRLEDNDELKLERIQRIEEQIKLNPTVTDIHGNESSERDEEPDDKRSAAGEEVNETFTKTKYELESEEHISYVNETNLDNEARSAKIESTPDINEAEIHYVKQTQKAATIKPDEYIIDPYERVQPRGRNELTKTVDFIKGEHEVVDDIHTFLAKQCAKAKKPIVSRSSTSENANENERGPASYYTFKLIEGSPFYMYSNMTTALSSQGKHWDASDTRVKLFDRGVVIKSTQDGSKVKVRWEDGYRGDYIYMYKVDDKQEVEYCPPNASWPNQGGNSLGRESAKAPKNKNKNKSKNN